jgi:hypothetical protein
VARPLVQVDPVGLEGESLITKGLLFIFLKVFIGFFTLRKDERRSQGALVVNFDKSTASLFIV